MSRGVKYFDLRVHFMLIRTFSAPPLRLCARRCATIAYGFTLCLRAALAPRIYATRYAAAEAFTHAGERSALRQLLIAADFRRRHYFSMLSAAFAAAYCFIADYFDAAAVADAIFATPIATMLMLRRFFGDAAMRHAAYCCCCHAACCAIDCCRYAIRHCRHTRAASPLPPMLMLYAMMSLPLLRCFFFSIYALMPPRHSMPATLLLFSSSLYFFSLPSMFRRRHTPLRHATIIDADVFSTISFDTPHKMLLMPAHEGAP